MIRVNFITHICTFYNEKSFQYTFGIISDDRKKINNNNDYIYYRNQVNSFTN